MNSKFIAIVVAVALLIAGVVTSLFLQRGNENAAETPVADVTPPTDSSAASESEPAPRIIDFAMPDLDGTTRQISDWNGNSRIVNFWATWCAPCRREIPLLKATQDANADKNVQIIGIAVDFPEEVASYAEEAQFNYPILVGQEEAMAAAEASGVEFFGMPFTMILAPDGELLDAHMGEIHESDIDRIVGVFADLNAGSISNSEAAKALQSR